MDEKGEIQAEGQVDSEAEAIDAFLRKLGLEIMLVGLEAGTLTQYLTYGLRDAGYQVVCMEARQVKVALSAMRYCRCSTPAWCCITPFASWITAPGIWPIKIRSVSV